MSAAVVDTGVGVVANSGARDDVDPACVQAAAQALVGLQEERVVIDDEFRILNEYLRNLHPAAQPGPGHAFVRWVFQHLGNPDRCEQVHITPRPGDPQDFEEFPSAPALAAFDPADRKFVAVACASDFQPRIVVAVDRGWGRHGRALRENGVTVQFLCPQIVDEE